ncbi:YecR family lipoprotein [Xanthomonas phaseoli]|uniref:YecR family lipoprotein n=1 Tax=Xanthomonas phaseoli TaxID=1985254 RepID=UPI001237A66A|nr:YecR family lipoprotein [Xanthomonas phaseoli]MBO9831388.1 hypothetical protein [Xanthomonas phaseoli pv. dieffenbachiae]MBO9837723.1 hypothetical protein [Xanthomonas phaseoli pv. dieffenbachiae]MBO9839037.1 hypothetical protein [Xanthomonas phaseoli pv. dieffenbachiae]MBO9861358.1 hypothetical protein [Xanthomonas phaseoli pv. dieffenbachiae]MBO9865234.1 hypothetical protein [Xanthomonas phaseoli pv. dieffenbachiae]
MKLKFCSVAGAALLLSACATHADWLVTKASRADGVVALSYERNEFQRPDMSEQQAVQLAEQKCKNWAIRERSRSDRRVPSVCHAEASETADQGA